MNQNEGISITWEPTPNPASLRFTLSQDIFSQNDLPSASFDFPNSKDAERSPLAAKIFGFPWTSGVFLGSNFVTVTKQDWVDWDVLAEPLAGLIREHIESGEPVLLASTGIEASNDGNEIHADDSEVVKKIKTLLNREIRPVVALDGGDIVFVKYENNVVSLHMKGSCAGCPSSTATLKEGVETRMREQIPEIKEVVSI